MNPYCPLGLISRNRHCPYGAFDFVVTPDGEWIMLECNPAGQWLWLQETGVPIAATLADVLVEGLRQ